MREIDRRLADLAATQHQVFSREQAIGFGLTESALRHRVRSGAIVRCTTHAYRFAGTTLTYRGRLMAGLLDLGPDAVVSGRAAAALHELDGFEDGPLEFLVPRARRGRTTAGVVRSTPAFGPLDRVEIDGLPCTSATRTVAELLGRVPECEAGNALDSACRKRLTAPSVVRRRLDEMGRQGRRGIADFERLMSAAGVESWLERRFLRLIGNSGLPSPRLQRTYYQDRTHVARVDFDFAPEPLVVEVGGRRGYLSFEERRRQERRRNALQLEGKIIYFFTREDVVEDPGYVVTTVRAGLEAKQSGNPSLERRIS